MPLPVTSPSGAASDSARVARLGLVLLLALLMMSARGSALWAQDRGMDRLEALSRALQQRPVWSTTYHQEYVPAGMTAGEEVDGVVSVSWPDRALFRAGDPVLRSMGLEGRSVRLVDLEAGSCDDHVLDDEEWARVPLAAVLDPRGALEHFSVLDVDGHGLALVPRSTGGVARVEVVLTADSLPKEVVVIDPQGSRNRLVFGQWQAGTSVPGGQWLPLPPQGVECIGDEDDNPE